MKTCPNCQTALADHSVFCTNCGVKVGELPPAPTAEPMVAPAPVAPPTVPAPQPVVTYVQPPVILPPQPPVEPHPDTGKLTVWSIICLVGGFLAMNATGTAIAGMVSLILGIINLFKINRANKQTLEYQRDSRIRSVKTLTIIGVAFLGIALLTLIAGIILYALGFGDVLSVLDFMELADEVLY